MIFGGDDKLIFGKSTLKKKVKYSHLFSLTTQLVILLLCSYWIDCHNFQLCEECDFQVEQALALWCERESWSIILFRHTFPACVYCDTIMSSKQAQDVTGMTQGNNKER